MQQQQQHLQQQQHSIMAAYASPNQVTTDIIQQYLDENKQLILAILDNQNSGKADECAENQAKLQRNLMYLAAVADSQPQMPTIVQYGSSAVIQSGPRYLQQHQQPQQMTAHSLMAARSSMLYSQSPITALQQQQEAALQGQLAMSSGGTTSFNILHGESSAMQAGGIFPDYARSSRSGKQESGNSLSIDARGGGTSIGQSGNGTEALYLRGSEDDGN